MLRTSLITAACIAAIALAALWLFGGARSYALTEIEAGATHLRIVEGPMPNEGCAPQLAAVANPLGKSCPQCRIVQRCSGEIDDQLASALADRPMAIPYVKLGSLRELVEGHSGAEAGICQAISTAMQGQKLAASCVLPR